MARTYKMFYFQIVPGLRVDSGSIKKEMTSLKFFSLITFQFLIVIRKSGAASHIENDIL